MPGEKPLITKLLVWTNLAVFVCLLWLLCTGHFSSASQATDRKPNSVSARAVGNSTDRNLITNAAQRIDTELAALRAEAGRLVAAKARAQYGNNGASDFGRIILAAKLVSTRKEYAAFVAKLGMSVGERENLFTLLSRLDIQSQILVQLNPDDQTLLGIPKQYTFGENETLTELRALLGEQNYAQFVAYRETVPARRFVDEYEQQLAVANQPLDEVQREALVAVMNSVSNQKYPSFADSTEVRTAFFDAQLKRYEEVLRTTRSTLTAEQHAALARTLLAKIEAGLRTYKMQDVQRAIEKSGVETK